MEYVSRFFFDEKTKKLKVKSLWMVFLLQPVIPVKNLDKNYPA